MRPPDALSTVHVKRYTSWKMKLVTYYIDPVEASAAKSRLCEAGVMAEVSSVDPHVIRLVGRWKSDAMFRYLHAQALPLVRNLARTMLSHGNFTLLPGTDAPFHAEAHIPPAALPIFQAVDHLPHHDLLAAA